MRTSPLLIGLLFLLPCASGAQKLPDLGSQAAWTEKEKQEFLRYIRSDQAPVPQGQVRTQAASGRAAAAARVRKARYAALGFSAESLSADDSAAKISDEASGFGPRLLVGGHLFSWVRYYAGVRYGRYSQVKLDGAGARLSHLEIPAGIELALIPLGTPHTRYMLVRGGVSLHNFYGARKAEFDEPLLGWREAWNLGLGYEWQFPDSNWRANVVAEGYRSFSGRVPQFHGLGLSASIVRTF